MEERKGYCSSCKYVLIKLKDYPCNECKVDSKWERIEKLR